MSFRRSIIAITALCALLPAAQAGSDAKNTDKGAAAQVAEVRKSFTLNGQIIPPGIFGDFGDNNLADSDSIWVTVDLAAAVGSNLYYDPIREYGAWKIQRKQRQQTDTPEETAYSFKGATANGLVVVSIRPGIYLAFAASILAVAGTVVALRPATAARAAEPLIRTVGTDDVVVD